MAKIDFSTILKRLKENLIELTEAEKEKAMESQDINAVSESERNFAFHMEKLSDAITLKKLDEKYIKALLDYVTYIKKQPDQSSLSFILTYASLLKRVGETFINMPLALQDYLTYIMIPIPLKQYENLESLLNTGLITTMYNANLQPQIQDTMLSKIWSALDFGNNIPTTKIDSWNQLMQVSKKENEIEKTM